MPGMEVTLAQLHVILTKKMVIELHMGGQKLS